MTSHRHPAVTAVHEHVDEVGQCQENQIQTTSIVTLPHMFYSGGTRDPHSLFSGTALIGAQYDIRLISCLMSDVTKAVQAC